VSSKEYAEAIKWYRKAAEQGHAEAQHRLGFCYANAKGMWFRNKVKQ